jgi:hypothetical protein
MLRSYLRDEIAFLLRHDILDMDEVNQAILNAERATFLDRVPVAGRPAEPSVGRSNGRATIALEVEV